MKAITVRILESFLKLAGARLKGEWLLVGGTVLPALGQEFRSTSDIDLVGLGENELRQQLQVMELAEELGLSIETINQAASYFVSKIGVEKRDLIELHKGKRAVIYRPSATLFLLLKIPRMTESDLEDCERMLRFAKKKKERVDAARAKRAIEAEMKKAGMGPKLKRLKRLERLLRLVKTIPEPSR